MSYLDLLDLDVRTIIDNKLHTLRLSDVIDELVLTQNCMKLKEDTEETMDYTAHIGGKNNLETSWCFVTNLDNPHNLPSNITRLHLDEDIYYYSGKKAGQLRRTNNYFVDIDKYGNTWLDIWKAIDELYLLSNDIDHHFIELLYPYRYDDHTLSVWFGS